MGSFGETILVLLHPSISTALMRPRRPKQYCLQLVKPKSDILGFFVVVSMSLPRLPGQEKETGDRRRDETRNRESLANLNYSQVEKIDKWIIKFCKHTACDTYIRLRNS